MRWRIPLVVVLALFVAVSCDQQPVEPPQEVVATAPAFDFTNGPPESGPYVSRHDDGEFGYFFVDEEYWAFAYTWPNHCALGALEQLVPYKEIDNPSNGGTVPLLMEVWKGEINVIVGTFPPLCTNVVATGVVEFRVTDNDVLAYEEGADRNRVNSYKVQLNGKVDMLSDGSTANLNALWKHVWTGWPDYVDISIVEFVKLN